MNIAGAVVQLLLQGLGRLAPHPAAPVGPAPGHAQRPFINYQIDAPAPDFGEPAATAVLLQHDFAASWGRPHTVPYSAPSREFSHVELTLEVETFGIQYDRLAHLYVGDVEVWRPSTSEPRGKRSFSSFTKDVSAFRALFASSAELSLELNNLVTERLNGTFNVTLTAAYFGGAPSSGAPDQRSSGSGSGTSNGFSACPELSALATSNELSAALELSGLGTGMDSNGAVPGLCGRSRQCNSGLAELSSTAEWYEHEQRPPARIAPVLTSQVATHALAATIPQVARNTTRAVLQIFASGNGNDEFWYAQSSLDPSDDRTGPVRHIVVDVNGDTAGVVAPFQQIYTGGFQPALWSPFVGVKAYDVPNYHIDVTPFLPDLWAAADTPVSFVVKDTHHGIVAHEWILSAALLTWEESGAVGSGVRYPAASKNHSASVLVPGTEITTFTSKVNVSADLLFAPDQPVRVEWLQEQNTDAVIHGELVVSHSTASSSVLTYNRSSYATNRNYELVLALDEHSIAVVQSLSTSDVSSPERLPPRDPRKRSVTYNGSWYDFDAKSKHNGSEVIVNVLDPWQANDAGAPSTFHLHALSRNGSVVQLESGTQLDIDRTIADISPARQWFSADLSPETLQKNREIRHAWLRHGL